MVALVVPAGNYEKEHKLLMELEAREEVDYTTGLSNTEAMDGYTLTDKLTAREFSELLDLDYEIAELLYTAYAVNDENYAKIINGIYQQRCDYMRNMLKITYVIRICDIIPSTS